MGKNGLFHICCDSVGLRVDPLNPKDNGANLADIILFLLWFSWKFPKIGGLNSNNKHKDIYSRYVV